MRKLTTRPSSAERWMNCPGNPRVQTVADNLPKEADTPYAAEGTAAHAWLEFYLGGTDMPPANNKGEIIQIPEEDKKILSGVADDILYHAEICGYEIETEKEYVVKFMIADGTIIEIVGHIDVLLTNSDSLIVLDYKHGAGRHVAVKDNPQTLLYLLAAIAGRDKGGFPRAQHYAMGIIQPRGVGDGWVMTNVPRRELENFRQQVLVALEAAYAPQVEYRIGPHCWKCPGQHGLCPAFLRNAIDCVVQSPPKDVFKKDKIEEIIEKRFGGCAPWALLDVAEDVQCFLKELSAYADTYLKSGRSIPGWGIKSVPGRRAWEHPDEVPGALAEILGGKPKDYERLTKTPVTLTEAEKIARQKGKTIDGLVKKPVTQKRVKMTNGIPLGGFSTVE